MTRYRTIVADPPWHYDDPWPGPISKLPPGMKPRVLHRVSKPMDYASMSVSEIAALPVDALAESSGCHLYLWTTNHHLPDAFGILKAWGFRYSQTLVWAKTPMGLGPGGTFAQNAEYILFGRRGTWRHIRREDSVWFNWKRTGVHSRKPEAFQDLVEQISPGPYLEMFARRPRVGWSVWGNEVESDIELVAA